MTYHILPESGLPIMAGMVQRITELEKGTDATKDQMKDFSNKIRDKFKEGCLLVPGDRPKLEDWATLLEDDQDFADEFNWLFDNTNVPKADDDFDPNSYNHYLNMELTIDQGEITPTLPKLLNASKTTRGIQLAPPMTTPS